MTQVIAMSLLGVVVIGGFISHIVTKRKNHLSTSDWCQLMRKHDVCTTQRYTRKYEGAPGISTVAQPDHKEHEVLAFRRK
jgi:hypothetical protein